MLHGQYAEELAWTNAEPEYFESDEVRDFIASVIMYTHKQYVKREDKGLKVKIKNVGRAIKAMQLRKRAKEFFANLFKKNDENDL